MDLAGELRAGAAAFGLALDAERTGRLLDFVRLLVKWNRVYNLTAVDEPRRMIAYHLLDSLSLAPRIADCRRLLDVGSGAGLPGLPLAIVRPDADWVLLDSSARKTRFIRQAAAECGVGNVQVVQSRVQDYHAPDPFDCIISRAYAPLAGFCDSVVHLLQPGTRLLTMKTELAPTEVAELDATRFSIEEERLTVPGVEEPRSLVAITPL